MVKYRRIQQVALRFCIRQQAVALLVSAVCALPVDAAIDAPTNAGTSSETSVELQEITVTATKREENLQMVPIAVSAIGATELEQRGIVGLQDLGGGKIPELRMQPFAGNQTITLLSRTVKNRKNYNSLGIRIRCSG